jgi:Cd2+/Zn2+-exporting ATPase
VVRPGETICVDGEITGGKTAVDESSITGESVPVGKQPGDGVYAGTLNIDGFVRIKALKLGEDSTMGKIIQLVKSAEQSKTDSARIVDQYAAWFTPVILACAALTYLITRDASRAVTVLIVGCPCSFLLAGPVSTVAAIGRAAKAGILVKGGKYLENIAQATAFYFDKTGTLTRGEPVVVKVIPEAHTTEKEILSLSAGIEKGSLHPLASAILNKAGELGCPVPEATDILSDPGTGISGVIGGQAVRVETGGQYDPSGYTIVKVMVDDRLYGHICMEDQPRPEARRVIREIQGLGVRETAVLSGDQEAPVSRIARKVGILAWYSRQKPEDKLALISSYAGGKLVYIGDGVNDAPGLKASSTGIAMGFKGSDAALETADIVLMNDNLSLLPFLITLSKKMSRIIKLNIGISFAVNLISVAAGFAGLLTPMLGAVSHNIGSITVVLLSASLGFVKED